MHLIPILFLLANLITLNPDFSQGFTGWNADAGWTPINSKAKFVLKSSENPAFLCSEPYSLPAGSILNGSARVMTKKDTNNGYLFLGERWYDENINRMFDEANWTDENQPRNVWLTGMWKALVPNGAKYVSFCAQGVAYSGLAIRGFVDDARLWVTP